MWIGILIISRAFWIHLQCIKMLCRLLYFWNTYFFNFYPLSSSVEGGCYYVKVCLPLKQMSPSILKVLWGTVWTIAKCSIAWVWRGTITVLIIWRKTPFTVQRHSFLQLTKIVEQFMLLKKIAKIYSSKWREIRRWINPILSMFIL